MWNTLITAKNKIWKQIVARDSRIKTQDIQF
jgi:hypothetical protein